MNGGTCNEVRDGYECICPNGYKGGDCEGRIIHCSRQSSINFNLILQVDIVFN